MNTTVLIRILSQNPIAVPERNLRGARAASICTRELFRPQIRPLIEEKSKVPVRYENLIDAGFRVFGWGLGLRAWAVRCGCWIGIGGSRQQSLRIAREPTLRICFLLPGLVVSQFG